MTKKARKNSVTVALASALLGRRGSTTLVGARSTDGWDGLGSNLGTVAGTVTAVWGRLVGLHPDGVRAMG